MIQRRDTVWRSSRQRVKITPEGVFLEQLERDPERFVRETQRQPGSRDDVVERDTAVTFLVNNPSTAQRLRCGDMRVLAEADRQAGSSATNATELAR